MRDLTTNERRAVLSTECPYCYALRGRLCMRANGNPTPRVHADRLNAYALRPVLPEDVPQSTRMDENVPQALRR